MPEGPLADSWHPEFRDGALRLAPILQEGHWPEPVVKFRAGRTLLDLEARQRPSGILIRLRKRFGPDLTIIFEPFLGAEPTAVLLDEHALGSTTVRFELRGEHEVVYVVSRER